MNTTSESDTSNLEKAFRESKTVSYSELESLKQTMNLWDIVCVKEENNKAYILLGKEDEPRSRTWINFNGEDKETLQKFFDWVEDGRKLYERKARSTEELDHLRQVMISIGILSNLMEDPDYIKDMIHCALFKIAFRWYRADHPGDLTDEQIVDLPEFSPYSEMVIRYVARLSDFITSVRNSVAEFVDNEKPKV